MRALPAFADDLALMRDEAWRLLSRGAADRRHNFHTPTLATIDETGAPAIRTLVLRGFNPATATLRFHTDSRAAKLRHISAQPRVAVHAYDPGAAIQLRLSGLANAHIGDDIARAAWAGSQPMGRMIYAIQPGPGAKITAPLNAPNDPDIGEANFAVLQVVIDRMEVLLLHASGHRRALFERDLHNNAESATWLVP